MLTQKVQVTALNPRRKVDFNDLRIEAVGKTPSQLHTKYDMQYCEKVEMVCPSLTDGKKDGYSPGVSFCLLRRQYDFIYSPQYVLNCLMSKLLHGTPKCSLVQLIGQKSWAKRDLRCDFRPGLFGGRQES